ncbi:tRNA (N6-threonylcarbamoyladenosine(37)-N6)-methyltransferase TrmO [Cognatishimia sp. F0-27]|uniref:tRNA (N6-threonylcarbamoyladenosine(37)-N6)-methyltransferase TrmO n=1 Tax=Cognatishimia sp. F0-27 TaxID=2816855 RepID=UPI001D0C770E|nr:tRNA (N6-threonylcarbamoyladenosine(37)-N6)-methyltransferase TrmO [Cognatishimia sp. F0-27]MCC1494843.1 tRNA (N6-threonylcarbamoyladenosine(37)-N6)-methyltransferase TrmO [Cognatishimia sp. F0-27]
MSQTPAPSDAPRPGETLLEKPLPAAAELVFIGHIETPFTTRALCPRQGDPENGPDCTVHLLPELASALREIERFDHIELLYWLHHARRDLLTQSPKSPGATRGTFSLRSPVRPNPIGTAIVRLRGRTETTLSVRGLDCLNGTPLLDIKPSRCDYAPLAKPKPGAGT